MAGAAFQAEVAGWVGKGREGERGVSEARGELSAVAWRLDGVGGMEMEGDEVLGTKRELCEVEAAGVGRESHVWLHYNHLLMQTTLSSTRSNLCLLQQRTTSS